MSLRETPPAPATSVVAVGASAALRSVYYGGGKGGDSPGGLSPGTARTVALTASAIRARNYAAAAKAAFCGTAARMGESKTQGVDLAAIGHGALDLLGFIPGIGAAADVANGLWYAAEGSYVDAVMSFVSAIPGVGDAAGAAKKLEAVHGNSKLSTRENHLYAIVHEKTGEVAKVGISSQKLNKGGTSAPRATRQVNRLNRSGDDRYKAIILEPNIPGRAPALQLEQEYTDIFASAGHSLDKRKLPQPTAEKG